MTTFEHVPVAKGSGVSCNHIAKECLACPGGSTEPATIPAGYTVHLSSVCRDVAGDGGDASLTQLKTRGNVVVSGNNVRVTAKCPFIAASGSVVLGDFAVTCLSGIHGVTIISETAVVTARNIQLRHTATHFRSRAAVAVLGMAGNNGRNDQIDISGSVFRNITADGDAAAVVLGHAVGPAEVLDSGLTVIQPIKPSEIRVTPPKLINVSALTNVFGRVSPARQALPPHPLTDALDRRTRSSFTRARRTTGARSGSAG